MDQYLTKQFINKFPSYKPNTTTLQPKGAFDANKHSKTIRTKPPSSLKQIGPAYSDNPTIEDETRFTEPTTFIDLIDLNPNSDTRLKDIVDCVPINNEYIFRMNHLKLLPYSQLKFQVNNVNIYAINALNKYFYNEKALLRLKHCRKKHIGSSPFWAHVQNWIEDQRSKLFPLSTPPTKEERDKVYYFNRDDENGRLILKCLLKSDEGYMKEYLKQLFNHVKTGKAEEISQIIDSSILASTLDGVCEMFKPKGVVNVKTVYIQPNSTDTHISVETFGRMETFPMVCDVFQGDFVAVYAIQIDCGPVQLFFHKGSVDTDYLKFLFRFGNSKVASERYEEWKYPGLEKEFLNEIEKLKKTIRKFSKVFLEKISTDLNIDQKIKDFKLKNEEEKEKEIVAIKDIVKKLEKDLKKQEEEIIEGKGKNEMEEEGEYIDDDDDDDNLEEVVQITEGKGEQLVIGGKDDGIPKFEDFKDRIKIRKLRTVYSIRNDESEKYENFDEIDLLNGQGGKTNYKSHIQFMYPENSFKSSCPLLQTKMTENVATITVDVCL
jgi:hypothetical protein